MQIDEQSKKDLEFDSICDLLSGFCKSDKAKSLAHNLKFFSNVAMVALNNPGMDILLLLLNGFAFFVWVQSNYRTTR